MVTNVIHRFEDIVRLKNGEIVYPHFATLHTSDVCNQKCKGCAYSGKHSGKVMDKCKHFQAVQILMDAGVKAFEFCGGGEPTLIPYLAELVNYIGEAGCHVGLMTNGTNMPDDLAKALIKYGTYVRFSLEAADPDAYQEYKGCDIFFEICERIGNLKRRRDAEKSDQQVSLKFAVGKSLHGDEHYHDIVRIGNSLPADRIYISALMHDPEQLSRAEQMREYGRMLQCVTGISSVPIFHNIEPANMADVPQCWLNPLHVVMDHNGDLYLCCYYYFRPESHKIGNIFEKAFNSIWFSSAHREKIAAIKREECFNVNCKFYQHHAVAEESLKRGRVYFL